MVSTKKFTMRMPTVPCAHTASEDLDDYFAVFRVLPCDFSSLELAGCLFEAVCNVATGVGHDWS